MHKHIYVQYIEDGASMFRCDCGVNIKVIVGDIDLVDYEYIDGRGTE